MSFIKCIICDFKFRYMKTFDFIHWNNKHENTKQFKMKPICEACINGIYKEKLDKYFWRNRGY